MPNLIIIIISLTLLCVIAGSIVMAIGGKTNKKYGNKLMQARVLIQFLAILLLYFLYAQNS